MTEIKETFIYIIQRYPCFSGFFAGVILGYIIDFIKIVL